MGLSRSPTSGRRVEQLREHPQQERGVEARRGHQLLGGENVDDASAVRRVPDEIEDVEGGLAEEVGRALLLEHQQPALQNADGGGRDVAVARAQLGGALAHLVDHGAQVLQVEDRHLGIAGRALVLGPAEGDVEHALLRLRQLEQAREQQRPHLLDGGAHGMALHAEHVPEGHREGAVAEAGAEPDLLGAADELGPARAGHGDAGQVALDVGGEHRHAGSREAFGQHLQRHGLAGAGGARDEAVAVGEPQLDAFGYQLAPLAAATQEHGAVLDVVGRAGVTGIGPRVLERSGILAPRRPHGATAGANSRDSKRTTRIQAAAANQRVSVSVCTASPSFANRRSGGCGMEHGRGSDPPLNPASGGTGARPASWPAA